MKIGDRVKVIELEKDDKRYTSVSVGMTGIITNYEKDKSNDMYDFVDINFDEQITYTYTGNLAENGYRMYKYQLEIVE